MASEITVTFDNGGIFNGVANSFTLNEVTTYYFDIDKPYRVQVDKTGNITLQQYKNTNGSWYNITIIKKVVVAEISNTDEIKEYLSQNYYNKTEIENSYYNKTYIDETLKNYVLTVDLDAVLKLYVKLEYLKENYYSSNYLDLNFVKLANLITYLQENYTTTVELNTLLKNYVLSTYLKQNYYTKVDIMTTYVTQQIFNAELQSYVQKQYLTDNYYDKTYIDNLTFDTGVTLQYLQEHYYDKTETDGKYVKKSGDTMTGDLVFNYDNQITKISSSSYTLFEGTNTDSVMIQLYYGQVFCKYLRLCDELIPGQQPTNSFMMSINGMSRSESYTQPFNFNCPIAFKQRTDLLAWMYIRNSADGSVSSLITNNGNWYLYNSNSLVACTGDQTDNKDYTAIKAGKVNGNIPLTITTAAVFQSDITSYSTINVQPSSGSGGNVKINPGRITVYSALNNTNEERIEISGYSITSRQDYSGTYSYFNPRGFQIFLSGQKRTELTPSRFDIYNGGQIYCHSGSVDTTEPFAVYGHNQLSLYNDVGTYNINGNESAITISSNAGSGATSIRLNCQGGSHYSLTDATGTVTGTGLYKAIDEGFYSESMLNALNLFLSYLQNNIKSAVSTFNKVSIIDFDPFALGDGAKGRGGRIGG